jgi:aminoacrylate hydrolase
LVAGLEYQVHGSGSGPAVLLSAGLGGAAGFWKPQLAALTQAGFRVITYDQRGTGASQQALPRTHSITDMADDVADIITQAKLGSVHLVGHALGAIIGLEAACKYPGLLASLSMVNGWAKPNGHTRQCFESRLRLLDQGGPQAYVQAQPLFIYNAAYNAAHWPAIQQEVAHGLAHFQGEANLRIRIAALLAFDKSADLATVQCPVWLSAAKDDALIPYTESDYLAQHLPLAQLSWAAYGGHAHNVTDAPLFNQQLQAFLQKISLQNPS